MPNIGPLEIAIVLVIVLLIFGPKRLPDLGRSMGRGMREFKESITGKDDDRELESSENVKAASADDESARTAKPADAS
jgi:sec-independent protein translocase protein TatA